MGEHAGERRPATRADIQGLRAVAVGLVVLDHAGLRLLGGGYVGVDVFFVVSGFLITSLLLREATTTGAVRIGAFYARRARRILPAATVTLVATTAAAWWLLPLPRARDVATDALWSAFFVGNVRFGRVGTDYFAADQPPSPLQHFWSLGVEEQFYVCWPLLVAVAAWWVARRGGRGWWPLAAAAAGASVLSWWWSVRLTDADPAAAYFSAPARAWELGVGALLAVLTSRRVVTPRWRAPLAAAGLTGIAYAAVAFDVRTAFPGWAAAVPVLATALVLAAGTGGAPAGPARLLSAPPMTWLGDVSYSLYLWHWPVLLLGTGRWPQLGAGEPVALVGLALVLATLSHRLVEAPFRSGAFWRPVPRSLALWPVALAMTVTSVLVVQHEATRATERLARASASFDPASVPQELRTARNGRRVHDALAEAVDRALVAGPIPYPTRNDLTELDSDRPSYGRPCVAQDPETSHDLCRLGRADSGRRVVVVGDSHALMWVPALERLGEQEGFEVVPMVKYGCTPYGLDQRIEPDGASFGACADYRSWTHDAIADLRPDLVVVSSRDYPAGMFVDDTEPEAWTREVQQWVEEVRALGPRVAVLGDVAHPGVDPGACLLADGATMADCTPRVDSWSQTVNAAVRRGARRAGAAYVDVVRLVCLRGRCPLVVAGVATYQDGQHVSRTWSRWVAADLGSLLGLPEVLVAPGPLRDSRAPGSAG